MKLKEFQAGLKAKHIDFALFYNLEGMEKNMLYFCQFAGAGALVIPAKKTPFLVVPRMELTRAKEGLIKRVYCTLKGKKLFEAVRLLVKKNRLSSRKIGIDKDVFTLNAFKSLKKAFPKSRTTNVDSSKFREIKTKKEIDLITNACRMSDKILSKCFSSFRKFKTESDVKCFLESEAKSNGCELAFPTIVASGKNAVKPHHDTKRTMLNRGFCVIDFGVRYLNYCSDTTRTIYLGKASVKEKKLYNLVRQAQENTIKSMASNKKCSEIYGYAKKSLGEYKKYFTHGLGHGIGINIHEAPNLTELSKDRIRENMIFTVEPGIYFRNIGIRIEDDIVIKNGKPIVLTKITKELIENEI